MATFTKKEVVLYPFPYTDLSNRKLRPCLVISNEMDDDLILCQITSQNQRKDQYCISITDNDTDNGKLQFNSYVRCNMLFTAHKSQLKGKLCKIENSKYSDVVQTITKIIAI